MKSKYCLWHGHFAPCKIVSDWIEGPGWIYRSDGVVERYWGEKRRVWRIQILGCDCGCDRSQYSRPETIYPEWADGLPVDNRLTHVTG